MPPGEGPSVIKSGNTGISSPAPSAATYETDPTSNGAGGGRYVGFGSNSAPPPKQNLSQRIVASAKAAQSAVVNKIDTYRNKDGEQPEYTSAMGGIPPTTVESGGASGYTAPAVPNFRPLGGGDGGSAAPVSVDTAYESRLVDEITMPAGVRAAPQKAQLQTFVTQCSSLDSYKIASLLGAKLADDEPVKTRIRALYVIEALLLSDIAAISDCFADQLGHIQQLCSDSNGTVREMALRVTDILQPSQNSGYAPAEVATSSVAATAPAPTASLLDLGGDDSSANGGGSSLFEGLVVKQDSGTAAPAPAPAEGAPSSMFEGMTIASEGGPNGAAAPPPASEPAASDPLASLFGSTTPSTAPTAPGAAAPAPTTQETGAGDLLLGTQSVGGSNSFDPLGGDLLGGNLAPTNGAASSPLSELSLSTPGSGTPSSAPVSGFPFMNQQSSMGQGQGQGQSMMGMPMSGTGTGTGMPMMGMQQQPPQQGFGLSGTPQAQGFYTSGQQQQGFGLAGTPSQSSPLIGGLGSLGGSGFGLSGTGNQSPMMGSSNMGSMGSMGTPGTPGSAHRSNSFGLSSGGKSPKKSDDPFSFISTTVTSEANKKS